MGVGRSARPRTVGTAPPFFVFFDFPVYFLILFIKPKEKYDSKYILITNLKNKPGNQKIQKNGGCRADRPRPCRPADPHFLISRFIF